MPTEVKLTESERKALRKLEQQWATEQAREKELARAKHLEEVEAEGKRAGLVLISAAKRGDSEEVVKLLKSTPDVNTTDLSGNTSLHKTAMYNHHAVARLLIKAGVKVDAVEYRGMTALMLAMANGYVETARELLQAGASLGLRSSDKGYTPLMYAALWGKFACCKLGVERDDGSVHILTKMKNGDTAASIAIKAGFVGVADYLSTKATEAKAAAKEAAAAAAAAADKELHVASTPPPSVPITGKTSASNASMIKQAITAAREKATEAVMRAVAAASRPPVTEPLRDPARTQTAVTAVLGASASAAVPAAASAVVPGASPTVPDPMNVTASTAATAAAAPTASTDASKMPCLAVPFSPEGSRPPASRSARGRPPNGSLASTKRTSASFRVRGKPQPPPKPPLAASSPAPPPALPPDEAPPDGLPEPPVRFESTRQRVRRVSKDMARFESTRQRVRRVSKDMARAISDGIERVSKELLSA